MSTKGYEVLVPELTIHREVGTLTDPNTGEVTGRQNGNGRTWFRGDVIPTDQVTPDVIEALENEDHPSHEAVSKRLREASGESREGASAPFAGYEELDEDGVIAAMRNLPSAAISRIRDYEAAQDDPRDRIVNYSIGKGESPDDRQEGNVGSDSQDGDEDKVVRRSKTRRVPDEGKVEPGEGITGTGDPPVPHGSTEEQEGGSRRRSRRSRSKKQSSEGNEGEGGSDE